MTDPARHANPMLEALRPFGRRFALGGLYFVALFVIGGISYVGIEGWTWFEALYMAVTTVTSVGFMEVKPLSEAGRAFTMVLLVFGMTALGIWWGLITALIVELDLAGLFRRRKMTREIAHISGHFIVCGLGRMGRVVVGEMIRSDVPFVVIEQDPARVKAMLEKHPNLLVLEDDATKEASLDAAKIGKARGLAACLRADADNLLLCLTARGLRRDLTIVVRASDEETFQKLHRAGADHIISPNVTGGIRMASSLIRPSVVSFLDVSGTDIDLRMEQAAIPEGSALAGQSLAEARIPQRTGLVVLALQRVSGPGKFLYNPGPDTRLEAGDVILVLGHQEQIAVLRGYVGAGP
jgi:voltage-gated potassium channel